MKEKNEEKHVSCKLISKPFFFFLLSSQLVLAELPVKSSDSKDSRGAGGAGGGGGGETIVRPIHETIGYVLAEQVRAPVDIPDKPVSIMV